MTNEDPNAPAGSMPSRRSPRQGVGGSPMGSTVSIVLAVVAVIVGFLILNNITDDGPSNSGGTAPVGSTANTTDNSIDAVTTTSTVPEPVMVTEGATVVVANASGVSQSAAGMTNELTALGFTMAAATNSTQSGLEATLVYYDPSIAAAQAVADSVARSMGGLTVAPVVAPIPIEGGSLNGAGVLVLLGKNEAGKTIAQLSAPVAGNAEAPAVSGDTSTGTATGTSTG